MKNICLSKLSAFKEIYAKNRNLDKEKREIKITFRRKIDKKYYEISKKKN